MNILVDIGNSRLKWGVEQAGVIQPGVAIDYRQADISTELRSVWHSFSAPGKVAVATVAETGLLDEIAELVRTLWPLAELVVPKAAAEAFGVTNAYRQPEKLGIDRWLVLLAAHRHYRGFSCVVDCGTAITADVIDADGRHLGGLISPGLLAMKKALAVNTAALGFNARQQTFGLADTTDAAIGSGTLLAAAGMIEAVLNRLDKPCRLILSGGDAELIAGQLRLTFIIDAELVLKGLSLYCNPKETGI